MIPTTRPLEPVVRTSMRSSCNNALLLAISYGRIADVRFHLLNPLANPNFSEGIALRTAIQYGHADIVLVLLDDARTDPSICDNASLLLAMRCGNIEVVKALLNDSRVIAQLRNTGLQIRCSVSLRMVQLVHSAMAIKC